MSNNFKCPFCSKGHVYSTKSGLMEHLGTVHEDELFDLSPDQVYFNHKNRYPLNKKFGTSVIFKEPTPWNVTTLRYDRFSSEAEAIEYRKQFVNRMKARYGKTHLLDDPETQKKMLAKRKISGEYVFKNGAKKVYTGKYEKDFLKKMDVVFGWDPKDIMAPAPDAIEYLDENNEKRLYIPDFYIASLDLLVEIKSGENEHYRKRDLPRENRKDDAALKSGRRFIKILDKEYAEFFEMVLNIRSNYPNDNRD